MVVYSRRDISNGGAWNHCKNLDSGQFRNGKGVRNATDGVLSHGASHISFIERSHKSSSEGNTTILEHQAYTGQPRFYRLRHDKLVVTSPTTIGQPGYLNVPLKPDLQTFLLGMGYAYFACSMAT